MKYVECISIYNSTNFFDSDFWILMKIPFNHLAIHFLSTTTTTFVHFMGELKFIFSFNPSIHNFHDYFYCLKKFWNNLV